jgi:hypothetical protein
MLSDDELADALEAKGSSQLFHDTEEGELMRQAAQRLRSRKDAPAPTPAREGVEALLREVRDKGLIYWEPQTQRGTVAKADMLRRIDAALTPTPPTAAQSEEGAR